MNEVILKAARTASKTILQYYTQNSALISHKSGNQNLVTTADIESQKIISQTIIEELQKTGVNQDEIGFIGEENLNTAGRHLFVIDPIDGTTNFASNIDYFCVSIAYFKDRVLTSGLIYNPLTDTAFLANHAQGCYQLKNNLQEKLTINNCQLQDAIMIGYVSSKPEVRELVFNKIIPLTAHVRGTRWFGSYALDSANLCKNIFNLIVSGRIFLWDIAAAYLIVKESGGEVLDWQGQPVVLDLDNPSQVYRTVSGHPQLLSQIKSYLK